MVQVSYVVAALATTVSGAAISPHMIPAHPVGDAPFTRSSSNEAENSFIGGKPVSVKDYPYVIAGIRVGGSRPQGQTCTGSVIAPRKILTAGHCADGMGQKSFVYGHDDLNKGTLKKIEVVSYKKHPKCQPFTDGYDVAVVTTKEDIPVLGGQYGKFATSANKGIAAPGKAAFALGYGKKDVDDEQKNVELHRGELPIVDAKNCSQHLKVNAATMICSGTSNGRPVTILPGDSGGPLVVDGVIVGVGSWSTSNWDWYSIYGRLDNDMGDWVAQEMKK